MSSVPAEFLDQVFIRKSFEFAGNTLLLYDYLLTLPLEITHIWNEQWTTVKLLFLINRYGNLVGQTFITLEEAGYLSHGSRQFCLAFNLYCTLFVVFSGESVRLLVVMRACAILRLRRSIAWLIYTLYVVYAVGISVLSVCLFAGHGDAVFQFEYLTEVDLCISPVAPNIWEFWFIPLFLDSIILVLVCYGLFQFVKGSGDVYSSRLICLLARDALLFYIATLFNVVFGIVSWNVYGQDPRNFLPESITYPFLSVIGQRLVLNLRRFQARTHSTRDLSWEVNRQIAAMDALELESFNTSGGIL